MERTGGSSRPQRWTVAGLMGLVALAALLFGYQAYQRRLLLERESAMRALVIEERRIAELARREAEVALQASRGGDGASPGADAAAVAVGPGGGSPPSTPEEAAGEVERLRAENRLLRERLQAVETRATDGPSP